MAGCTRRAFFLSARWVFIVLIRRITGNDDLLNGFFDELFDVDEIAHLIGGDQGNGGAMLAGAPGAANAVDIVFRRMRQLVVDDMRQIVDI